MVTMMLFVRDVLACLPMKSKNAPNYVRCMSSNNRVFCVFFRFDSIIGRGHNFKYKIFGNKMKNKGWNMIVMYANEIYPSVDIVFGAAFIIDNRFV